MNEMLITLLKCTAIYFLVLICLRLLGKRSLAEISPIDLAFLILIGSTFGQQFPEDNKFLSALFSIVTLTIVNYTLTKGINKFKNIRKIVEGEPVILVRNGKVYLKRLDKENISMDHLKEAFRDKGINKIEDVNLAILETNGKISVIK